MSYLRCDAQADETQPRSCFCEISLWQFGMANYRNQGRECSFNCPLTRSRRGDVVMQKQPESDRIVYVLDDDFDVRDGLKALFESVGWKTEVFASTAEFLRAKRREQVSCLVLDIRLPGSSGLEFQEELANTQVDIPI